MSSSTSSSSSSPSSAAPRCKHIKVCGTQCGSPALRKKNFCFYHQQNPPIVAECYAEGPYSTGEIDLPAFEDAHSIQAVLRQVMQMVIQKRIERKTASLLLYALQIASSNLKRIEQEKPQPEQVVLDFQKEKAWHSPTVVSNVEDSPGEPVQNTQPDSETSTESTASGEDLPPGTIQACYRPYRAHGRAEATVESFDRRKNSERQKVLDAVTEAEWRAQEFSRGSTAVLS